jgi:hypothetical protein
MKILNEENIREKTVVACPWSVVLSGHSGFFHH